MGFGSYDESDRDDYQIDSDVDEGNVASRSDHDGELAFEYDEASSDDLLKTFQEITGS